MMKLAQLTCCLLFVCVAAGAQAQAPFYEGKNILLVSGTDAGGAGDLRTRALLAPMKKHIPGIPTSSCNTCPAPAAAEQPITFTSR